MIGKKKIVEKYIHTESQKEKIKYPVPREKMINTLKRFLNWCVFLQMCAEEEKKSFHNSFFSMAVSTFKNLSSAAALNI